MKRLLCRVLGHHWARQYSAPRFFVCSRCGEPGWVVPE